ncbi:hypothetical protein [Mesorhizobium loti]|uniref:hypothetical protein n=1 Tax=Rhizobium loti TaxID=381 RepID=UPI003D2EB7C4
MTAVTSEASAVARSSYLESMNCSGSMLMVSPSRRTASRPIVRLVGAVQSVTGEESFYRADQSVAFGHDLVVIPIPPAQRHQVLDCFRRKSVPQNLRWHSDNHRVGRNVFREKRIRPDDSAVANRYPRQDNGAEADPDIVADLDTARPPRVWQSRRPYLAGGFRSGRLSRKRWGAGRRTKS